jgi:hypothetical protein
VPVDFGIEPSKADDVHVVSHAVEPLVASLEEAPRDGAALFTRVSRDDDGELVQSVVLNMLAEQAIHLGREALAARYRLSRACDCFDRLCAQRRGRS